MVHVPSLSSVSMGTGCMGSPYISLYYHTKQDMKISYGKWDECERDFNRVKSALKEVESALEDIVLTEDAVVVALPSPSKVPAPPADLAPVTPSVESGTQ